MGKHLTPEIMVIGSINMDLVVRVPHFPAAGETIAGTQFQMIPGGKGANQAVAASRLGSRVAMIGRVGQDLFGQVLLEGLNSQGVDTQEVRRDEEANTGIAMIMVDPSGENRIVIAAGANGQVSKADVEAAQECISRSSILITQFEIPLPVVEYALAVARRHGVTTILNAAPGYQVSIDLLEKVDYLVLNEGECHILTGIEVGDASSAQAAARHLLKRGPRKVIVTLGEKGALLAEDGLEIGYKAPPVAVVDTTAAGDAFIGGLAVALLQGFVAADALYYAICAGSLAVTKFGAQSSLPSAAEVHELYRSERPSTWIVSKGT